MYRCVCEVTPSRAGCWGVTWGAVDAIATARRSGPIASRGVEALRFANFVLVDAHTETAVCVERKFVI